MRMSRKSHVIECARETLRMSRRNEKEIKAQHVRPPIRHRVCQLIFLSRLKLRKKFNEVAETNVKSPISRHFQFRFSYKNKLFLNLFYAARGKKQEKSFNLQLHNVRDLFCALRQKASNLTREIKSFRVIHIPNEISSLLLLQSTPRRCLWPATFRL